MREFFMKIVILPSILNLFNLPKDLIITDEGNENNSLQLPYKLCRVVEGKKPYIVFYIWNENIQKLERVRREPPKNENQKIWLKDKVKLSMSI
jgi:hypothetical protein